MKKYLPIYVYGSLIILAGVFLLMSENRSFQMIKMTLGTSLIVGAIFAFVTAFVRQRQEVQFAYHQLHALAMLVYGISLVLLCNSTEKLILFTAFLFVFYAVSEILFFNWLFNLAQKVVFKIVAVRALLGLVIGVGTVVSMNYAAFSVQLLGAMFILVGVNILLYVPVMKAKLTKQIN